MNSRYATLWRILLRLLFKGRHRAVGFDLASIGEVQFFRSVLEGFSVQFPDDTIWIFHHTDSAAEFNALFPHLVNKVIHAHYSWLSWRIFRRLNIYVTTEQFVPGPPSVFTLTLFHGQPSKGLTFSFPGVNSLVHNDAFFLYGPLQRQALDEHLMYWGVGLPPHLSIFNIGYTKSDELIGGCINRCEILKSLSLDPAKKTILYAPAFNEGASMLEYAEEILPTLCAMKEFNILAKLAIDCMKPTTCLTATCGINWFEKLGVLEKSHANFKLVRTIEADGALAAADVLITCVSSISFEFLALGKPVVFIDTPKFFTNTLADFFPGHDLSSWANRTSVNAGREFGLVVAHPRDLPQAVNAVLMHPDQYPLRKTELRDYLLYNPGRATETAIKKIAELLDSGVRSKRPDDEGFSFILQAGGGKEGKPHFYSHIAKIPSFLLDIAVKALTTILNSRGYKITKTGLLFLDAKSTIKAARQKGMSVCDFLESKEDHPDKIGRRDRIIEKLKAIGVFENVSTVCEIGPGTGRYLEKVIALARPEIYEVYETDRGWVDFLEAEYGGNCGCTLRCHNADGITLQQTGTETCDLVHAHAVFVYLPLLQTLEYLKECVRICRPGGYIVFDCFLDTSFTWIVVELWLKGAYRFPVIIPGHILEDFARNNGLCLIKTFSMIYGANSVDYHIWQKAEMTRT